jgi:hypothetical protein
MSKEHDDWVARHLGVDPATYELSDPDPDLTTSVDPNAGQSQSAGSTQSSEAPQSDDRTSPSPAPADGGGGMTGTTADGAPYSSQGNDGSAGSQAATPAADGGGGMTGTTSDGTPFSAQGNDGSGDGGQSSAPPPAAAPPSTGDDTSPGFFSQVGQGLQAVGSAIGDGLHAAGQAIGKAVDAVEDKIVEGVDNTIGAAASEGEQVANAVSPPQFPPRGLNGTERSYAGDIFFSTLDYSKITITGGGVATWDENANAVESRTIGNTVNLAVGYFNADGTLTDKGLETLVHEMTHVWQFQHTGWSYIRKALVAQGEAKVFQGDSGKAYDWKKLDDAKVPWAQWNPEAQAQSIEDYNVALREANAGKGTKDTFKLLERLQPYVDQMVGGAKAGDYPAADQATTTG